MTDRDALIVAVLADPIDDLPRLVFADWLEERGEPDLARMLRTLPRDQAISVIQASFSTVTKATLGADTGPQFAFSVGFGFSS